MYIYLLPFYLLFWYLEVKYSLSSCKLITYFTWMCVVSWTDSNTKLPLFGRALKSEVKLDPLELLGTKYKVTGTLNKGKKKRLLTIKVLIRAWMCRCWQVNNMLDGSHPARDFHNVVKPAIDDLMGREVTFDILFHNSEHQVTLLRYGVKNSEQVGNSVQGALIQNDLWTLR